MKSKWLIPWGHTLKVQAKQIKAAKQRRAKRPIASTALQSSVPSAPVFVRKEEL